MIEVAIFLAGTALGAVIVWFVRGALLAAKAAVATTEARTQAEQAQQQVQTLQADLTQIRQEHNRLIADMSEANTLHNSLKEKMLDQEGKMRTEFKILSGEVLKDSNEEFIKLAKEVLSGQVKEGEKDLGQKHELIDKSIEGLNKNITEMEKLVRDSDKDREQKFGALDKTIKFTAEQADLMRSSAMEITSVLKDTKKRGEWGERMAEDVLRLAGFVEGVNYLKQETLATDGSRPDFSFPLPNDLIVHMDVKFPFNNYVAFVNAEDTSADKEQFKKLFISDVKARIKEVTKRGYIDTANKTLDYVILFIPNEQVYGFIHQTEPDLMDEAIKKKVIMCGPLTLYAILSVIRQSVENFSLAQTSGDILKLLKEFKKQWDVYIKEYENLGKALDNAQDSYANLIDTRHRKLDVQVRKIDKLREHKEIAPGLDGAEQKLLVENDDDQT